VVCSRPPAGDRSIRTGTATAASADGSVAAAIAAGVDQVRYRTGLAVARMRLVLGSATLVLLLASPPTPAGVLLPVPVPVGLGHLAVAAAVLLLLRRRLAVGPTLLSAAAVDVAVVMVAGLRATAGGGPAGPAIAWLLAVTELLLLLAAATLPRRQALGLALAAVALLAWLAVRATLAPGLLALLVLTAALSAAAAVWAAGRMVELGARLAVDAHAADLRRRHQDELAAAMAARGDEVRAAHQGAVQLTRLTVHDLRNPLTAFLQIVALARARLEGRPELAEVVEELDVAAQEGNRLADMVGDLLLVFRGEAGALAPRPQPVMVHDLLRAAARAADGRARDRGVAIELEGDPELAWPLDLDLCRRLLDNLLGSALRAVRRGDRIGLTAGPSGGALVLTARTTGPPVPPELRSQLFERQGPGRAREWHHAGLGLYLCRLVAEAHGGSIALVDDPPWSVAFQVRFPGAAA
jgi:signal transduction histidine kinase